MQIGSNNKKHTHNHRARIVRARTTTPTRSALNDVRKGLSQRNQEHRVKLNMKGPVFLAGRSTHQHRIPLLDGLLGCLRWLLCSATIWWCIGNGYLLVLFHARARFGFVSSVDKSRIFALRIKHTTHANKNSIKSSRPHFKYIRHARV